MVLALVFGICFGICFGIALTPAWEAWGVSEGAGGLGPRAANSMGSLYTHQSRSEGGDSVDMDEEGGESFGENLAMATTEETSRGKIQR